MCIANITIPDSCVYVKSDSPLSGVRFIHGRGPVRQVIPRAQEDSSVPSSGWEHFPQTHYSARQNANCIPMRQVDCTLFGIRIYKPFTGPVKARSEIFTWPPKETR